MATFNEFLIKNFSDKDFISEYRKVYINTPEIIDGRKLKNNTDGYEMLNYENISKFPIEIELSYDEKEEDDNYVEDILSEDEITNDSSPLEEQELEKYKKIVNYVEDQVNKNLNKNKLDPKTLEREYKLNSSYLFSKFIKNLNDKYKDDIKGSKKKFTCNNTMDENNFSLMKHQVFVRNYINL